MKTLIITDAYLPQINGVVNTLLKIKDGLKKRNHKVYFLSHRNFFTFPCPTYPEIKLSMNAWTIGKKIEKINPDFIHIATEGPVGFFAKIWCDKNKVSYTTSYHTMFPEYLKITFKIPTSISYKYFKWFHNLSKNVLVPTESIKNQLEMLNFSNLKLWTRGVDHNLFHPNYKNVYSELERPIFLNVGRASGEKGLDDFLSVKLKKGTKVVVGDGPLLKHYKKKYKDVIYCGYKHGKDLASHFASADFFVFPSKTDTFGLVNVEAMACGLPVIAYDVQGPRDIITHEVNGILIQNKEDMIVAMEDVQKIKKDSCVKTASKYTWDKCVDIFEETLILI